MHASPKRRPFGLVSGTVAGALFVLILASLPVSAADNTDSAITAARFSITIDGYEIASFSELQGITTEVKPVETSSAVTRTMTVTLKRGLTRNIEMAAWHELVLLGDVAAARKSVELTAFSPAGAPVIRYHLTDAWPSKIEVGSFKNKSGESVMTETVTLTCDFIQRVNQ
jgi:phage tail-like protein